MGHGSLLILFCLFALCGVSTLSFFRTKADMQADVVQINYEQHEKVKCESLEKLLKYDLQRMGVGLTDAMNSVLTVADSTTIRFFLDADANGIWEQIEYAYSPDSTGVPRLIRSVDNIEAAILPGLVEFRLTYLNAMGYETTDFAAIRTISVSITLEHTLTVHGQAPRASRHFKISPRNLVK